MYPHFDHTLAKELLERVELSDVRRIKECSLGEKKKFIIDPCKNIVKEMLSDSTWV